MCIDNGFIQYAPNSPLTVQVASCARRSEQLPDFPHQRTLYIVQFAPKVGV